MACRAFGSLHHALSCLPPYRQTQGNPYQVGIHELNSGALIAVAVVRHGAVRLRRQVLDTVSGDWRVGRRWQLVIAVLVPLQALALLGWWIYLSASSYAPNTWYDPFDPYSVATCHMQWGIGIVIAVFAARRLLHQRG